MSGIVGDALNVGGRPSPKEIKKAGADGVRLVARDDARFVAYANDLSDAGMTTAVVIARESCANDDYGGWASYYSERVWPQYWVLSNEMDAYLLPVESPSSWSMRPAEFADFWHQAATAIRERQPHAQLIVGGLVSGQPWWASGVKPLLDPPPNGWDVHPYSKNWTEAADLLAAYREQLGGETRFLVLEWHQDAREIGAYTQMLATEAEWDCFFCWSDQMVNPFGLYDEHGEPKLMYRAFQAAGEDNMAEPNEAIQKTIEEFEAAGGNAGTIYAVDDVGQMQIAHTDAGLFISREGVPGAQILLDARAENPFE